MVTSQKEGIESIALIYDRTNQFFISIKQNVLHSIFDGSGNPHCNTGNLGIQLRRND